MQGLIAAVPTPVDESRQPQKQPFAEHCQWALSNGCDGLNILGSTGEANSFDAATRKQIMRWAVEACGAKRLMVGTGTPSLAETISLTEAADDLGYGVALVLSPYYYKPASDEGLIAWYTALHEALGDRRIELYFYNFPQMTGLAIPLRVIETLARRFPARFTGIKDSSGDLDYCRNIVELGLRLKVFPSSETVLSHAREDGFAGCISATVNITAPLCAEVWKTGSAAPAALQDAVAEARAALAGPSLIPGIKHMVGHRTGNALWRNTLPPFLPLAAERAQDLETALSGSQMMENT